MLPALLPRKSILLNSSFLMKTFFKLIETFNRQCKPMFPNDLSLSYHKQQQGP